jgi:hypothetical protein
MAITPAVAGPLEGDARRRPETSRGIDGAIAALAGRRGWVCRAGKSALAAAAAAARPASRRRYKSAGFARGAHGRKAPPATAADAKTIGRIRTAPA